MPSSIALVACLAAIAVLIALDRDRTTRTSQALLIPVIWLLVVGSRSVSQWLSAFGIWGSPNVAQAGMQLDGSPLDRNVYLGMIVLGVLVLASRGSRVPALLRANGPILAYLLYGAASCLWSDYPDVAFKRWVKAFGDIVMVAIVLTDPYDPAAAIKRLFVRVSAVLAPLSVVLIRYFPDVGRQYRRWTYTPMYTGVATQKNGLGMLCMVAGIALVWRLLSTYANERGVSRRKRLAVYGSLLGITLWLLWMADSKTSLACLAIGAGVVIATSFPGPRRSRGLVSLIVAVPILVSSMVLFADAGSTALSAIDRDPTLTGRSDIWSAALAFAGNPLVGCGFESFWLGQRYEGVTAMIGAPFNQSHNGYLEVYLNLGWIGVAVFAVIMASAYRRVSWRLRQDPEFGGLWLAYFVVTAIYNLTESALGSMCLIWSAFALGAMDARGSRGMEGERKRGRGSAADAWARPAPEAAWTGFANNAVGAAGRNARFARPLADGAGRQ
jgi:exopolysaccharide production protein ExoQ